MKLLIKILGGAGLLIVMAFAGGVGKLVGNWSVDSFSQGKHQAELDGMLMEVASRINENLPMMVDAETRLNATSGMNNRFRYSYTLVNYTADEISPEQLNQTLGKGIVNSVCTTDDMQVFVKNGVSVIYAYNGMKGNHITSITVPPSKCTAR